MSDGIKLFYVILRFMATSLIFCFRNSDWMIGSDWFFNDCIVGFVWMYADLNRTPECLITVLVDIVHFTVRNAVVHETPDLISKTRVLIGIFVITFMNRFRSFRPLA